MNKFKLIKPGQIRSSFGAQFMKNVNLHSALLLYNIKHYVTLLRFNLDRALFFINKTIFTLKIYSHIGVKRQIFTLRKTSRQLRLKIDFLKIEKRKIVIVNTQKIQKKH